MKKILRAYMVLTSVSLCAIILCVGVLTAKTNTRKMSFGEEYEAVQIYNTSDQKVGISSGDNGFEIPKEIFIKTRYVIEKAVLFLSPVISNLEWLAENIKALLNE